MDFSDKELYKIHFDWNKTSSSKKLSIRPSKVQLQSSPSGYKCAFGNYLLQPGGITYWEIKLTHGANFIIGICILDEETEIEDLKEKDESGKYWYDREGGYGLTSGGILKWKNNFPNTHIKRTYGRSFGMGDTIGLLLDSKGGTLNYFINGVYHGPAFINKKLKENVFVPVVGMLVDGETIELLE